MYRSMDSEERYKQKISIINGIDPYKLDKDVSSNPDDFPKINLWCIGNYLVFKTSHYTHDDFNAYKSLEAYTQFACGWVRQVYTKIINDWHVVIAKVMHSQRLREKPLETWIIAAKNGEINSAHCSCMAGLGEACIHVAALLFYIESYTQHVKEKSVTDVASYWTPPAVVKNVAMAQIDEIDFSKKRLCVNNEIQNKPKKRKECETTDKEFEDFLQGLASLNTSPSTPFATLLAVTPFCDKFETPRNREIRSICSNSEDKYPPKMTDLFRKELMAKPLESILAVAETLDIKASPEQCASLEKDTKRQSKSKLWFHYRAGRITASVMKRVCSASLVKPPLSLIKQIVYPERMKFFAKAIEWGCTHEENARQAYVERQEKKHIELQVISAGLHVSQKIPYVGASPDGVVSCLCCGMGCLEIKCPYCLRDAEPEEVMEKANFLGSDKKLKKTHQYFFQVQTHLFVTELEYCDFVVWTKEGILVERIQPDLQFWSEMLEKAKQFHNKILLPELLSKHFTSNKCIHRPTIVKIMSSS